ncbi:TPA: stage V sporulation protein S [bacterium]|nr:stage V sporulation protein S [bacterium]
MVEVLKVSSKSNPNLVAGALVNILKENENVEIHSIGAGALNQSIKAVAIARGFVAPSGKDIVVIPSFLEVTIDGQVKTAIKLTVRMV